MLFSSKVVCLVGGFHCHNLGGAGLNALATLDAVGIQIARCLTATVVRRKLHGAYAGTTLTLHLAAAGHANTGIGSGQWLLFGSHPGRQCTHGAERTPRARRIDEREQHTHYGGDYDEVPEYPADATPHG